MFFCDKIISLPTLFIFSLHFPSGGVVCSTEAWSFFPQDRIYLCGFSAAALPCWEQDQATESLHWIPDEVLTASCLQCLDEGNHPVGLPLGQTTRGKEGEKKHKKKAIHTHTSKISSHFNNKHFSNKDIITSLSLQYELCSDACVQKQIFTQVV